MIQLPAGPRLPLAADRLGAAAGHLRPVHPLGGGSGCGLIGLVGGGISTSQPKSPASRIPGKVVLNRLVVFSPGLSMHCLDRRTPIPAID